MRSIALDLITLSENTTTLSDLGMVAKRPFLAQRIDRIVASAFLRQRPRYLKSIALLLHHRLHLFKISVRDARRF